jgi:hypothetical protein
MDAQYQGTYLFVNNALSEIFELTLMRGAEVLAGPIEEVRGSPSSENLFDFCCRDRFGVTDDPGGFLSYKMVVSNEKLACKWFEGRSPLKVYY